MTDNGALVFNLSGASTFGGAISGVGSLTQAGTGMLTLTGSNTYTGGTTVSAGTLQTTTGYPNYHYGALGCSSGIVVNGGGTLLAAGRDNSLTGTGGNTSITVNAGGLRHRPRFLELSVAYSRWPAARWVARPPLRATRSR